MRVTNKASLIVSLGLSLLWSTASFGQVTTQPAPSPPQPKQPGSHPPGRTPVIVGSRNTAPQVVTILHRLNGIKMFRLLLRSGNQLGAIANLDDAFKLNSEVHTNVIAGLAMDDGTIVAWLPEAEAEMAPVSPKASKVQPRAVAAQVMPAETAPPSPVNVPFPTLPPMANLFERPDLTVIPKDGRRVRAQYLGLDGLTGLSVLKIGDTRISLMQDAAEEKIDVGQRLRLFGPEPARQPEARATTRVYVRVGEVDARITRINRTSSGNIARVQIGSAKLAPANIGAVAINDEGETVGIVDAVEGNEAYILPSALVRSAARRVVERQSSVPRPWLGVRGEAVAAVALEQILRRGWQPAEARALSEKQRGILLTSIAPGSPAASAALKPGDVILSVNDGEVRDGDDFSSLLQEAGPGRAVRFKVLKPSQVMPESVDVRLSESFELSFSQQPFEAWQKQLEPGSLMAYGIEAIPLQSRAAARLGATGGLLVVSIQPYTIGARAGLRSGDVIEAVNGQQLLSAGSLVSFTLEPGANCIFEVIRNRQKLILTYVHESPSSDKVPGRN